MRVKAKRAGYYANKRRDPNKEKYKYFFLKGLHEFSHKWMMAVDKKGKRLSEQPTEKAVLKAQEAFNKDLMEKRKKADLKEEIKMEKEEELFDYDTSPEDQDELEPEENSSPDSGEEVI